MRSLSALIQRAELRASQSRPVRGASCPWRPELKAASPISSSPRDVLRSPSACPLYDPVSHRGPHRYLVLGRRTPLTTSCWISASPLGPRAETTRHLGFVLDLAPNLGPDPPRFPSPQRPKQTGNAVLAAFRTRPPFLNRIPPVSSAVWFNNISPRTRRGCSKTANTSDLVDMVTTHRSSRLRLLPYRNPDLVRSTTAMLKSPNGPGVCALLWLPRNQPCASLRASPHLRLPQLGGSYSRNRVSRSSWR